MSQGSKGKTLDQKSSKPVAVSVNNDEEWEQIPMTVDELTSDVLDLGHRRVRLPLRCLRTIPHQVGK